MKDKSKQRKKKKGKSDLSWIIGITVISFISSTLVAYVFSHILQDAQLFLSVILLLIIILIGIVFDTVGIAVTATDSTPFISMASNKMYGAKRAIVLVKNANRVSSFCNDVIGDISGIISGITGAIIIAHIITNYSLDAYTAILTACSGGLIAAFTIGGKAIGKTLAIKKSKEITYFFAKVLEFFSFKKMK